MKKLGLINKSWQLTPRDSLVEPWSEDIPDKDWELANMETYAAMVDIMDQGIGQIVEVLKANGELENTIIFFLQDNGACAEELEWVQTADEEEIKPLEPGALQTKMMPDITRDGKIVKLMKEGWPGPPDGYTAYGRNWANASNTPFREYKHWVHEGGISTPLIVHWPAGIREPDKMIDDPAHLIDIMATCVAAGAANYPANFNENEIVPMEGKSLIPYFEGESLDERALFWEHEGNRAVRLGRWKLVSKAAVDPFEWWDYAKLPEAKWELFDMEADRTELHDLSDVHPQKVAQLSEMWMDWANRTGTVPRPQR
jgi:arylsulfatase